MPSSTTASLPKAAPLLPRPSPLGRYLLVPTVLALGVSWGLMAGGGDQWLADQLYHWQGNQWALKDAWWTSHLLHKGGKNLVLIAVAMLIAALVRSCIDPRWRQLRRPLAYLLLAVGLSTGVVSLTKAWTGMDCPWDLQRYGGMRPFTGLFDSRPDGLARAACYPAGHASAGYAWIALYFFLLQVKPAWRLWGVAAALTAGAAFGWAQQLRGAHFLSHDVASLWISWTIATSLYLWMFKTTGSADPRSPLATGDKGTAP